MYLNNYWESHPMSVIWHIKEKYCGKQPPTLRIYPIFQNTCILWLGYALSINTVWCHLVYVFGTVFTQILILITRLEIQNVRDENCLEKQSNVCSVFKFYSNYRSINYFIPTSFYSEATMSHCYGHLRHCYTEFYYSRLHCWELKTNLFEALHLSKNIPYHCLPQALNHRWEAFWFYDYYLLAFQCVYSQISNYWTIGGIGSFHLLTAAQFDVRLHDFVIWLSYCVFIVLRYPPCNQSTLWPLEMISCR